MSERILLCGFYGCGNFGDDVLLLSLLRAFSELRPDASFSYLSGNSPRLSRMLLRAGVNAVPIPRMKPAAFRAIAKSDTVVLGGGSVLQNVTGQASLLYYLSLLRFAEGLGKKTAILAGGLGPIGGEISRRAVASVLGRLDYASFRDEDAAAFAEVLGVNEPRCSADPALLLSFCDEAVLPPLPKHFFLVSLRKKSGIPAERAARGVYLYALKLRATPVFCDLFPAEDAAYTSEVMRAVSRLYRAEGESRAAWYLPSRFYSSSPEVLLAAVGRARFVLSARYHLALFAYSAGVPFYVLGDDPKLRAIALECRSPEDMRAQVMEDIGTFFGDKF